MNRISAIRRLAVMLAGLAGALLASTAVSPAAFAVREPPPGGYDGTVHGHAHTGSRPPGTRLGGLDQ